MGSKTTSFDPIVFHSMDKKIYLIGLEINKDYDKMFIFNELLL